MNDEYQAEGILAAIYACLNRIETDACAVRDGHALQVVGRVRDTLNRLRDNLYAGRDA